jgi:hypothetical protein
MAGLVNGYKKPAQWLAFLETRHAAITAAHADIKTNLFRTEKEFYLKCSIWILNIPLHLCCGAVEFETKTKPLSYDRQRATKRNCRNIDYFGRP